MRLTRLHGQAFAHKGTHWNFVCRSHVCTWDRDTAPFPAAADRFLQDIRAVALQSHGLGHGFHGATEIIHGMGFATDGINAAIRSPALGEFLKSLIDIFFGVINCFRFTLRLRHFQPFCDPIDGDHSASTEHPGTFNGELSDGTAAPDGHSIAGFHLTVFCSHIASRKDVREEQHHLVWQPGFDFNRAHISKRDSQVFSLSARIAAEEVREPKQPRRRVSQLLLREFVIGIRDIAQREQLLLAKEAISARDRERHDDAISWF